MHHEKIILVTAATSYIGSYIIKLLLERNYKVRATVRSLTSPVTHQIRALDPSGLNLELVQADMNHTETFPSLVSGVHAAIHTAMPMHFPVDGSLPFETPEEAFEKQVQPGLSSTTALLEAAANAKLHKVVITSSISAVLANPNLPDIIDESCWSDEQFCRDTVMAYGTAPYNLSKTMQEKLAWQLSKKLNLDVVCINPAFVWGPSLIPRLNASLEVLLTLVTGTGVEFHRCAKGTIPNGYITFVDIREVALAHVLAVEKDNAEGRYLLASHTVHCNDILSVIRENPTFAKLPELKVDDGELAPPLKFDCSKVRYFGVTQVPWEDTVRDSAKSLVDAGHVH